MFCAILYGEIRTIEKCLPSIKRFFNDNVKEEFIGVNNCTKIYC